MPLRHVGVRLLLTLPLLSLVAEGHSGQSVQVVRGEVGKEAWLPCDVESSRDDSPIKVLWIMHRDNQRQDPASVERPFYTVEDSKRRGLWNAEHAISAHWLGRASFSLTRDPAALKLTPLKPADSGIYLCSVTFHSGARRDTALQLIVGVKPSPPVIRTRLGKILEGTIGPFLEGDSLELECLVEGGFPTPTLTWKKDGSVLSGGNIFEDVVGTGTTSTIVLEPLSRADLLSRVTCEASNAVAGHIATSVTVDLLLPPLYVKIERPEGSLAEGKPTTFRCYVAGYRSFVHVSWRITGHHPPLSNLSYVKVKDNATISTLPLLLRADHNSKELGCFAYNPALPEDVKEDFITLNVRHAPRVTLSLGRGVAATSIIENTDVYMRCQVRANPEVKEVEWTRDGSRLGPDFPGLQSDGHYLVLGNITRSEAGRYACNASNALGVGHGGPLTIDVLYAPTCIPMEGPQRLQYGSLSEQLHIPCRVEAMPSADIFRWTLQYRSQVAKGTTWDVVTTATGENSSLLRYKPTSDKEFLVVTCWARNAVGESTLPCTVLVEPRELPAPPVHCSMFSRDDSSLRVECLGRPLDEIPVPSHFFLELYDANSGELLANATSEGGVGRKPSFEVGSISDSVELTGAVFAVASSGRSEPADVVIPVVRPISDPLGVGTDGGRKTRRRLQRRRTSRNDSIIRKYPRAYRR